MCNCQQSHPGTECSGPGCHCHDCPACGREHDQLEWNSLGMVCGRCGKHTGNNHQGHYWGFCNAIYEPGMQFKDAIREMHFCCPDDCELEASDDNAL